MAELARWSLKVSRQTDIALRTLLATRGGKKGDLSRFIEDAVNREVLREMAQDIRVRNTDLQPDEIMRLVDEETSLVRQSFWDDRSN
ncbi:ribbon-helix-helix domain-containing protein [Sphingobium ummariense]